MSTIALTGGTLSVAPARRPHDIAALKELLAEGWQIESPVLARLSWAQHRTGDLAYHFILTRAGRRSLVVVADSREVHDFVAEFALLVVGPPASPPVMERFA